MPVMQESRWTLDELAERVDAALAVDYPGQPSGRVRAVPDRRAIRWYTTIGLIDRPLAHRGRTALYGPRHLLQLVAVKRLQASGLPLVSIQQQLAGATDTQLARVARVPAGIAPAPLTTAGGDGLSRTGAAGSPPAAAREATARPPVAGVSPGPGVSPAAAASRLDRGKARAAFWREPPAAFTAAAATEVPGSPALATRLGGLAGPGDPADPAPAEVAALRGVRLGEGATLLLEPGRELGPDDVRAVLEAAGPLLAVVRDRGLGGPSPGQPPTPWPAAGTEPRRERP
jgi:DNA-binding transcriptional MerR regulator